MNPHFKAGLQKIAEDSDTQRNLIAGGAGLATAIGTYALMRRPSKGLNALQRNSLQHGLTKSIGEKAPKGNFRRFVDKIFHGVDDIHYANPDRTPRNPMKTKSTVIHTETWGKDYIKGKHEIGSGRDKGVKLLHEKKDHEMKLLDKIEKKRPKTIYPDKTYRGKKGLSKVQQEFGNDNFFIKGNDDAATGVGGSGFISAQDLKAGNLSPEKEKTLRKFMKNPEKFTVQKDMGIEKDLLGQNKEFRIHVMGNKVVPGASSPRSGNVTGAISGEQRDAEKYLQSVMKKLPKEYRNTAMAADIAKTKDGFKIVELNAGTASSGFLDPKYMNEKNPGLGALTAIKNNHSVYKALTGRDTKFMAGVKGVGSGTLAGVGAVGISKAKKKEQQSATLPPEFHQSIS